MLRVITAWAVLLGAAAIAAGAQQPRVTEAHLKAAYLYNFAKFVEWPEEAFERPAAPIVMCVAGDDELRGELDRTVAGKSIAGHVVRIAQYPSGADAPPCHLLYAAAQVDKKVRELAASLAGSHTLLVGVNDAFTRNGGVIAFIPAEGKLRFQINPDAAARAGLKFNAQLLAMAVIVRDARP